MSTGGDSITFNQTGQTVETQTNVGKVEGGLNITSRTTANDMSTVIAAMKSNIAALQQLPPSVKQRADKALDEASGLTPSPSHQPVKAKLDECASALKLASQSIEDADGFAKKAASLAETLFKIGKWVVAIAL